MELEKAESEILSPSEILGRLLVRGNGGSYESDIIAIRKAANEWFNEESQLQERTPKELAVRFATWVLYQFHQASTDHLAAQNGWHKIEDDAEVLGKACWSCLEVGDPERHEHEPEGGHWHHYLDPGDGLPSPCSNSDLLERIFQELLSRLSRYEAMLGDAAWIELKSGYTLLLEQYGLIEYRTPEGVTRGDFISFLDAYESLLPSEAEK